jgi:hypothetical protein
MIVFSWQALLNIESLSALRDPRDFSSLIALGALNYFELHLFALFQRLIAVSLYSGVVNEYIFTRVGDDESESFFIIEPLYGTLCHYLLTSFYLK